MAAGGAHDGIEINGVAHVILRVKRITECIAFYDADIVRAPEEGPWAPGYYSLSFRDPEGIRLELNHVPGPGLLAEETSFDPAPDHPIEGRRRAGG